MVSKVIGIDFIVAACDWQSRWARDISYLVSVD